MSSRPAVVRRVKRATAIMESEIAMETTVGGVECRVRSYTAPHDRRRDGEDGFMPVVAKLSVNADY